MVTSVLGVRKLIFKLKIGFKMLPELPEHKQQVSDTYKGWVVFRMHRTYNYVQRFGRGTVKIVCPFCDDHVTAYVWSLNGGGKKCSCGALHTGMGISRLIVLPKK